MWRKTEKNSARVEYMTGCHSRRRRRQAKKQEERSKRKMKKTDEEQDERGANELEEDERLCEEVRVIESEFSKSVRQWCIRVDRPC